MPVPNHDLSYDSQDENRNHSDPMILASPCEKEDIPDQSQLRYNTSCTDNHYILSRLHSFCIKSDCVLNFQTFDRLLWYIEHLIKEHSRDALCFWEVELCQSQNQSITTFLEKLLCHPKNHQ